MGNGKAAPPGFEAKPEQYLGRPVTTTPGGQRATLGRARRTLAPAAPDVQTPAIGGRWQEDQGRFNAMINQAGTHIECWITPASTMTAFARAVTRLGGDRTSDTEFSLYVYPDPTQGSGKVQLLASDRLQVTLTKGDVTGTSILVPNDPTRPGRPTFSDAALALFPPEAQVYKLEEQFPLTRQERQLLKDELGAAALSPLIMAWLNVGSGTNVLDRVTREKAAGDLDTYVGGVFSSFHPDALPLVRERGRNVLEVGTLTYELTTRTLLDWLGRIVNQNDQEGFNASKTPNMKQFLGLGSSQRTKPFRYDVTYLLEGYGETVLIGLGGYFGTVTVTKRDGPGDTDAVLWKQDYEMWIGSISGGLSFSERFPLGTLTSGKGISFVDYAPSDIPGWVTFLDFGAKLAVGVGGSVGYEAMEIHGNGAQPTLFVDCSGPSGFAGLGITVFELGMSGGKIFKVGEKVLKRTPDTRIPSIDYAIDAQANAQVHFALGDAFLTPQGRQLLRIFCAAELAMLSSEGSALDTEGHADRIDTADRNDELSLLRAKNAVTAIQDILGAKLGVPSDRIAARGLGERRAAEAHEPDGSVDPNFRKVEVVLDGRLSVTLVGG
jgi:outer membrane protein OmpA-like peptidoglycan-associated protein